MAVIYVDADACPVKAEIEAVATRHRVEVKMVCNGGLRPSANPLIQMIYVDAGLDVADRWIAERAGAGDIVVTADIPLAADCVAAGARVLKPDGDLLTPANIGNVLATRDLMTDLREADPLRPGSGRSFTKADRSRFRNALETALRAVRS
ncbi:YaiI/YqxD family protein [Actibacterium sp. 188UL27-1]|uniref:YaiI/YqxD family protein n=1 Tax=Actibacterium sp. 188UL27-1 TaxID=2786961 RepID=UPI00195B9281|nr:YaiI/YqxD family protein [Actibacterium sp. 188UL27-1]